MILFKLVTSVLLLTLGLILYTFGLHAVLGLIAAWSAYTAYCLIADRRNRKLPPTNLNVCIVGGGFSGIGMGIKLKEMGIPFRIVEKAPRLGGTWYHNIYPGCACDIPSHLYSFSFFPNPKWSTHFSPQKEILSYLEKVVQYYKLKIDFNKRVVEASWNGEEKKWRISFEDGEEYESNILVSGCGVLHIPTVPAFKGKNDFKGDSFHSALWDENCNVTGKRVGIIGTGASAVQIVPSIAEKVEKLYVFQRTPAWVLPKNEQNFSNFTKNLFTYFPLTRSYYRAFLYLRQELLYYIVFHVNSPLFNIANKLLGRRLRSFVKDQDLQDRLVPRYHPGCKRVAPSAGYLEAFSLNNVSLVTDGIDRITMSGIKTVNEEYPLDLIIYATGFDLIESHRAFSVKNGSTTMESEVGDTPQAYLGITHPKFPNLFYLLGPNTALGHSSVVFMMECQLTYICDCIKQMAYNGYKSLAVKQKVHDHFQEWLQTTMKTKVFYSGCLSWYKNERGINFTLWPTDCTRYWWRTRKINLNDYDYE